MKILLSIVIMFGLLGCGGTTTAPLEPTPAFATRDSAAQAMIAAFDTARFTPLADLPTQDTVTYNGYMGATIFNNIGNPVTRIIGDASIALSFGQTRVTASGNVTDFIDETQGPMDGQLVLSDGILNRGGDPLVDPTFTAQASGALRWPNRLNRQVDIVLEGDLRGTGSAAIAGEILGQHMASGGNGDVIGSFILER